MIGIMIKNQIITNYKSGMKIKQIARLTGLSKNTVKKYIRENDDLISKTNKEAEELNLIQLQESIASSPRRKIQNRSNRVFNGKLQSDFNEIINRSLMKDDILGNNKQVLTGAKIHQELTRLGHKVSESTIRLKYRQYKGTHKEVFIKQSYDYGARMEYDFHQVKLKVANQVVIYHQVTIAIPSTNHYFIRLYKNENTETVVCSLIDFINYCGGVYKEFVFDNMSTVVKRLNIKAKDKQYTDEIIKLSNYYGFKIVTCNVRKGNEKGTVENGGRFIRNDLFSLNFEFDNEEDLTNYYQNEMDRINQKSKFDFEEEKKYLLAKPQRDYIYCTFDFKKANSYSLINVDGNFYSIPEKYVGKTVKVYKYNNKIDINYDNEFICEHKKIDGKGSYSITFEHYIKTFLKKPAAITNSLAMKQLPIRLQSIYATNYINNPKLFIEDLYDIKDVMKVDEIEKTCVCQLDEMSNYYA